MNFESALGLARHIFYETKCSPEEAANNSAIPEEHRDGVEKKLQEEQTVEMIPSIVVHDDKEKHARWLDKKDRNEWYYWPRLRNYLITEKKWPTDRIRSLDKDSDDVLQHLSPPEEREFGKRGLVLGYVQSGKTANYTSLIAKAADVGYRLFIVLAGMDNGLRRQTQIRLEQELVGYPGGTKKSVEFPSRGKQWHVFTSDDIYGDFQPGNTNTAALQGTQPVLLVVKKNVFVLEKILAWLSDTDKKTIQELPVLVIDDEADQASIDTTGSRITEGQETSEDYQQPTRTNSLIRRLLRNFTRCSFVAYTATPFANILIPANQYTRDEGNDLYPKDFIISLPKPRGYWGAEQLFGTHGFAEEEEDDNGLNVLRPIPENELEQLNEGTRVPESLQTAILDFGLAGAAKAWRDDVTEPSEGRPAAMLIHISHLVTEQGRIKSIVENELDRIRDEWRYNKNDWIRDKMKKRWKEDFAPIVRKTTSAQPISFEKLEKEGYIGRFLESIDIKVVNSESDDILDYETEPSLKAIVIGGNKLSRGLTIEGLLISYFTRRAQTPMYDTLMQMGRWFGYREEYGDLTRLYVTDEVADMFSHMASVEHRLREDMTIYSSRKGVTPENFGMRILAHPSMLVTNRLKQRFAGTFRVSYSGALFQTFRFPLDDQKELARSADLNLETTKEFLSRLSSPQRKIKHLIWEKVRPNMIIDFLDNVENREHSIELSAIKRYVEERNKDGELVRWTVVISQSQKKNDRWGCADWGIGMDINQISRTLLLKKTNSLGVISDPEDENIGLSENRIEQAYQQLVTVNASDRQISRTSSAVKRTARPPDEGLLLLYPISKNSVPIRKNNKNRAPLYSDPNGKYARDLIGISIPFPESKNSHPEIYIEGTPGWRQNDE